MGYIYMVWCEGFVKIGFTRNFAGRMNTLIGDNPFPIRLLRVIENQTRENEKWLHNRFAAHRHKREWFRYCDEMMTIEPERIEKPVHPHVKAEETVGEWPEGAKLEREVRPVDSLDWLWPHR